MIFNVLAKSYHQTVGRGLSLIKEKGAVSKLTLLKPQNYFPIPKPVYISQLANAKTSKVEKLFGRINDKPASKRFGAKDLEEFSYWAWKSCGIVDLQMILKTVLGKNFSETTMDLVKKGLEIGGYNTNNDIGWYHEALAKLGQEYGLKTEVKKFIPSSEIAIDLLKSKYVVASVKSVSGGHLLLIYGFKISKDRKLEGFWLNDPTNYKKEGKHIYMRKNDFEKIFTRRVITFQSEL